VAKEAADAVSKQPLAAGIHVVAACVLCAKDASENEIALAGEILRRAPKREAPRELEDPVGAFNRQMDVAIESCNASEGAVTRAERRAKLAADLDRAGLVLIGAGILAELVEAKIQRDTRREIDRDYPEEATTEELGAELLADEPIDVVVTVANAASPQPVIPRDFGMIAIAVDGACNTVEFALVGDVGRDPFPAAGGVHHEPTSYSSTLGDYTNPSVND
jgi:hypothetical protein